MMNIQNLGLQESVGVKYINGIHAKLNYIFVILLSHCGFECDPETNFQTMNHFIKSVQKQLYANVLQSSCS